MSSINKIKNFRRLLNYKYKYPTHLYYMYNPYFYTKNQYNIYIEYFVKDTNKKTSEIMAMMYVVDTFEPDKNKYYNLNERIKRRSNNLFEKIKYGSYSYLDIQTQRDIQNIQNKK